MRFIRGRKRLTVWIILCIRLKKISKQKNQGVNRFSYYGAAFRSVRENTVPYKADGWDGENSFFFYSVKFLIKYLEVIPLKNSKENNLLVFLLVVGLLSGLMLSPVSMTTADAKTKMSVTVKVGPKR